MTKAIKAFHSIFAELDSLGMTPTIPIDDGDYEKPVVGYVRLEYDIVLQELERGIPKRPYVHDENSDPECPNCGQALDWEK